MRRAPPGTIGFMAETRRLDGVDVLRGLSILAVILLHIWIRMRIAGLPFDSRMPAWLAWLLFRNGNNGVTVFFAISGFLIATTSIRRFGSLAGMRPARFYRIRFARIMPSLLLILAILSTLHLAHADGFTINPSRASLPRALFAALTFHLNWLEAARGWLPPNWDVLWSLSIEEMFYLFFPLACVLLLRRRRGIAMFIAVLAIVIVLGPFQRAVWPGNEIWKEKAYLGGMDGIASGCLCALFTERIRRKPVNPRLCWIAAAAGSAMMLLIALWPGHWPGMKFIGRTGLDDTILPLGACLVIAATTLLGVQGSRFTAPIRWMGRHSYEIYLTHEFIVVWGCMLYVRFQKGPQLLWVAAITLLAMLPGAALARWFSEPLNEKLRGRPPAPKAADETSLSLSASPASF
ncbi:MAG TPA: acyltransferase [Bryobacteraceae bacterium]|nr:acyltransferase [Bryobacteraceae bacterium]